VWLEPVPETHITALRTLPDIDAATLTVGVLSDNAAAAGLKAEVKVKDNGRVVAQGSSVNGCPVEVRMPEDFRLWSPDSPNLYDLEVTLYKDGKAVDKVNSYAAMRKFSSKRDNDGIVRLQLNNRDIFQFGPLDQGWWPDGLLTPPSHEAMVYDVDKTKDLGFNMIRKHIKVEPATWYTYCDRKGIIVWQDMPSGDRNPEWQNHRYFDGTEMHRSAESEDIYCKEWAEIIDCLYSYPCISTWIPFNEAWGQFKTQEITEWTKRYDPSRLVNPASGGNFYPCGDILDLHNYPGPAMYLYDAARANVLGEYGGIGYVVKDHIWAPDRNWGYIQFNSPREVTDEYVKYAGELLNLVGRGFTGAVYTQTTDVEVEVNGFMTYDRKVDKMEEDRVRDINTRLVKSLDR
ncbi:MAG: beta-galactosidase, partial [Muribaculaceae bacterium]|nr:beta-galactosidase [Muribaculaceae bacterium]